MAIGDDIVRAVEHLVPGVRIAPRRAGALQGLSRRAIARVGDVAEFDVELSDDRGRLRLVVPAREDLFIGAVVLVVQTVDAIAGRVPRLTNALRTISVDESHSDRALGLRWAGVAHGSLGTVNLRADAFLRDGKERSPVRLVGVVAHECWHQVEHDFEVQRYRDSLEFRRKIGEYFGVETLEHVIGGSHRTAPPAWRDAHDRLASEVSSYATKSPKEATAELFAQWWILQGRHPLRPVHDHFGRLLHEFNLVTSG